mmetsp:Transcript_57223/g.113652  ORF Transcript_57223/g.113652 Transcript_57223/m.113652 type:complete len:146 (-) Transcript_57223:187-624(-)
MPPRILVFSEGPLRSENFLWSAVMAPPQSLRHTRQLRTADVAAYKAFKARAYCKLSISVNATVVFAIGIFAIVVVVVECKMAAAAFVLGKIIDSFILFALATAACTPADVHVPWRWHPKLSSVHKPLAFVAAALGQIVLQVIRLS